MQIKKIETAFSDERGTIADIFYKANIEHIAIIKTKDNGRIIRGNHFHKLTTQHIFMTKGSLKYWYRDQDKNSPIKNINVESWLLIFYQALIVSLCAHLLMFYLYKFYTVGRIFPFYSLFPIFGIILTYMIFDEVPTTLFILGGIIVVTSVFFIHKIK